MEPGDLVRKCVEVLTSFKPAIQTVDSHAAAAIAALGVKDADEQAFIQQSFYGICRSEKLLGVFVNALYHVCGGGLPRADVNVFRLLAYLAIFRLDELGFPRFAAFLASQEVSKMHRFMGFLFDEAAVAQWVKEDWCKFLDRRYVEGTLLGALGRHRPAATKWLSHNKEAAFGAAGSASRGSAATEGAAGDAASSPGRRPSKPPTVPVGPRITQARPRTLPEPERIAVGIKASPVPEYLDDVTLEDLGAAAAARRESSRRSIAEKYASSEGAPRLHETRRTIDRVRTEVEAARAAELRFDAPRATPLPVLPAAGADVRLNAAAVLREEAVYRRQQAAEAAEIARYEAELRDAAEYERWCAAGKDADEAAARARFEGRLADLAAAARLAAASQAAHAAQKAAAADASRAEAREIATARERGARAEVEAKRGLVAAVRTVTSAGPALARAETVAARRAVVEGVRADSAATVGVAAEARRREGEERARLIRQLRGEEAEAAARAAAARVKTVDLAATSGARVLDEISLAELRERQAALRAEGAAAVQERRRAILEGKRNAQEGMRARLATLSDLRAAAAEASAAARAAESERVAARAAAAAEAHDSAALALSERLAAQKAAQAAAQARLRQEADRIAKRNLFLGAGKAAVEERRHAAVLAAAERRAASTQAQALESHAAEGRVRAASASNTARYTLARRGDALGRMLDSEAAAGGAAGEAKGFAVAEGQRRSAMFLRAVEEEATLRDLRDLADPFAAAVRGRERDMARTARGAEGLGATQTAVLLARADRVPEGSPLKRTMSLRLSTRVGAVQ